MTLFDATPDAPFIQRARIPDPDRPGRRRLTFGRARGRRPGIRLRDGTGHLTTFQDPREKADEALAAELAEATREVPGEHLATDAGLEAWHRHQQRGGVQ